MANPNIVNVSSIYFQNAGISVQSAAEAIITVDADKVVKINSVYVCNTEATDETFTIAFTGIGTTGVGTTITDGSGGNALTTPNITSSTSIPANTTVQIIDNPIYMMEGDVMTAGGGTSNDDLEMFVSWEIFDDA